MDALDLDVSVRLASTGEIILKDVCPHYLDAQVREELTQTTNPTPRSRIKALLPLCWGEGYTLLPVLSAWAD